MLDRSRYLDAREAAHLLTVARGSDTYQGERNYIIVALALNAGLRLGEIANLNCGDFVRDENGAPALDIWESKGGASRRVRITEGMAEILANWASRQRERHGGASGPMFTVTRRRGLVRISRRMIEHAFKALARQSGLPDCYSFHCLRHTFATYYFRQTKDLVALKEVLGHRKLSTTGIYVSVSSEDHARNLRALPAELRPNGKYRRAKVEGGRTTGGFLSEGERRTAGAPLP